MKRTIRHSFLVKFVGVVAFFGFIATSAFALNDGDDNDVVAQLKGTVVTTSNVHSLVSVNQPINPDSIYLLYNVGTKQFLNMGGYWGTGASLSDHPRYFWMQRRTKEKSSFEDFMRYPETAADAYEAKIKSDSNELLPLLKMSQVQVGSVEGNTRSLATYVSANIVEGDTEKPLIKDAYQPNGQKFYFTTTGTPSSAATALSIDFSKQSLEVKVNLDGCTNDNENILSVGSSIKDWAIGQIHLYYSKSSKKLEINSLLNSVPCTVGQQRHYLFDISGEITITLSGLGLTVSYGSEKKSFWTSYYGTATIPYVAGQEGDIIKFKSTDGTTPDIQDGALVIDQNGSNTVKLKATYAHYTYATACQDDLPAVFFSSRFTHNPRGGEGMFLGYSYANKLLDFPDDGKKSYLPADMLIGMYVDRNADLNYSPYTSFTLRKVEGTEDIYTLSLYAGIDLKTGNQTTTPKELFLQKDDYYIRGYNYNTHYGVTTYGDHSIYYDSDPNHTGEFTEKPNDGIEINEMPTNKEDAYWKIISLSEYRKLEKTADSELEHLVDVSYLIGDPDFDRKNTFLNSWQTDGFTDQSNQLRIGIDGSYKTKTSDREYSGSDNYNGYIINHARYMALNIHNGGHGKVYQDVKISYPGWWVLRCHGLSNAGGQLFIQREDDEKVLMQKNTKELITISDDDKALINVTDPATTNWPFSPNQPIYNSSVLLNDNFRLNSNTAKYIAQTLLYIEDASEEHPVTVRVGVEVKGKDGVAAADEWTVVDDFSLYFGGLSEEREPFIVLDEDKTDLHYIDDGIHLYKNKALLLHRTLKKDKWNTLVMPVNLTTEQFKLAFGDGATLAELSHITASTVEFKSVKADDSVFFKAGTPYIIKVTEDQSLDDNVDAATQTIWTYESNGALSEKVTLSGSFYKILGVTLVGDTITAPNGIRHYNFTGTYDNDNNLYTVAGKQVGDENGSGQFGHMQMKGTYCKTYANDTILENHPSLNDGQDNYIWVDDQMLEVPSNTEYGQKGLRCWFTYTPPDSSPQSRLQVVIDGVATGITLQQIDESEQPARHYCEGVYNLSGQFVRTGDSLRGLPAGMYIVNGKKTIVNN